MVRVFWALGLVVFCAAGCDDGPAPAAGAEPVHAIQRADAASIDMIAQAAWRTSPPVHPTMSWPELAPIIESARAQIGTMDALERPAAPSDVLAERIGAGQLRAIAAARERVLVYRAEAARLLARGDADGAWLELALVLGVSRELAGWGFPGAAEAAAEAIDTVLTALDQPDAARMTLAMSPWARTEARSALLGLDRTDPAGRLRGVVESSTARAIALERRAQGADGPAAVREVATRYVRAAERGDGQQIERLTSEARAFARAMADSWDKPMRSAVTERLRQRQTEDGTGVLVVLLADAADACDADGALRDRIARAVEDLR